MPKAAQQRSAEVVEQQWGRDLIQSWNSHEWIDLPVTVGEKIAPLLGAAKGQVICCDSTSVNLFKLLCCALNMQKDRQLVLSQTDNFPADLYIAQGLNRLSTGELCELEVIDDADIEARLDETVSVLMLTHVNFRSGKLHDMRRLTELAHAKGALVIWDLAHSTGALPLALDEWGRGFCRWLWLQIPEWRTRCAGIYLRGRTPPRSHQTTLNGLDGTSKPFFFLRRLPGRSRCSTVLVRHTTGPFHECPGRGACGL